ncbi:MAG: protein kinase [Alphaproteobacteria bacterium]|nr:protein kinase [Alphaproteobacteria bacterium]
MSKVAELFQALCEQPPARWEAALAQACPEDPALQARVLALLRRDAQLDEGGVTGRFAGVVQRAMSDRPERIGPFLVDAALGEGGMGAVWRAHHAATGLPVAIKTLRPGRFLSPETTQAARDEILALARLSHPHIVGVLDQGTLGEEEAGAGLSPGSPYLVMELVEGGTLAPRVGQLDWPTLQAALAQVLDALAHAHARGFVHRDIKPENVLIDGALPRVRLSDFGIAYALNPDRRSGAAVSAGTPAYMAPEQVRGELIAQGPWTDLYALGAMSWAMATGAPPFTGATYSVLHDHVHARPPAFVPCIAAPEGLEGWCRRLLEKHPMRRFRSAAEAAWSLAALAGAQAASDLSLQAPRVETGATLSVLWRSPALASRPALPGPAAPMEPTPLPVPAHWRAAGDVRGTRRLGGLGIGLVGLREAPLVGRRRERDKLWARLVEVCREGRPRLVILEGPSGMGKSRLARWLCERAAELGVAGSMRATHEALPGARSGLAAMVGRDIGALGLPWREALEHARLALSWQGEPQPLDEAEALAELVSPASEEARTLRISSALEVQLLVTRAIRRRCAERPCVLWLDDVQWGSEALRLAKALLSSADLPVLIVLTAQEEGLTERPAEARVLAELARRGETLPIGPLPPRDRAHLVRGILGLGEAAAAWVEANAAGNPLYMERLVGGWVRRGVLVEGERGYELMEGAAAALPEPTEGVWSGATDALLSRMPEGWQRAAELGATLGQEVSMEEWMALGERVGARLNPELLAALAEGGLGQRRGQGWAWSHTLLRESILRAAAREGRLAGHHAACAGLLAERGAPPGRVGLHRLAAGDLEGAIPELVRAMRLQGLHEASQPERFSKLVEEAFQDLGLPPSHPWVVDARCARAVWLYEGGSADEGIALLRQQAEAARASGDPALHAEAVGTLARLLCNTAEVDAARAAAEEALAVLPEPYDLEQRCILLTTLALAQIRSLGPEAALEAAQQAVDLGERIKNPFHLSASLYHQSMALSYAGRLEQADAAIARAIELDLGAGHRSSAARCYNVRGDLARRRADLVTAERCYRDALALGEACSVTVEGFARLNLGILALHRDEPGEAYAAVRPLWLRSRGSGSLLARLSALILLTPAATSARWDDWRALLEEVEAHFSQHLFYEPDLPGMFRHAWVAALRAGEVGEARRVYALEARYHERFGEAAAREALAAAWAALAG